MKKIQKILGALLGSAALLLIVFGVFAAIALLSGNLMVLFGFRYETTGSLLLFFLLGAVVGLPLEILSAAIPRCLYEMGKVSRREANILYIPLDTLFTVEALWLIDHWMESVSATGLSLCILGFSMAVATLPVKQEKVE